MIRGEKKPFALSFDDWNIWKEKQRKERPWRYWMSDTVLRKLQNFLYYPSDLWYSIRCYTKNRYLTQTHNLKTGLKKGEWHDLDTRILYGLFNELVEFVEVELAHLNNLDRKKKYKFKNGRCVEAAYDYFQWANNLQGENNHVQRENSIKIKELYEWWKHTRPNRDDPIVSITKESHGDKYYQLIYDIEKDYDDEDTEMLIDLIKIRNCLWT